MVLCFMLLWGGCWAEAFGKDFHPPKVILTFPQGFPATIYNGQVLEVPMHMSYVHLRRNKEWSNRNNGLIYVANKSGQCPDVIGDNRTWHSGECDMVAVLIGNGIGNMIHGSIVYRVFGKKDGINFDISFPTPVFTVTVVRRPLSMQVIAPQNATVGQNFQYFLRDSVANYWESMNSNARVVLLMSPAHQQELGTFGLYFDPNDFSFKGKPNKVGSLKVLVGATNGYSETKSLAEMTINVHYDKGKTPRFKSDVPILSATSYKKYQLNLMTLLENMPGLNITDQVRFKLDDHSKVQSGLALSAENHLMLEGVPNPALAGDMAILTVTASSNTGGDSLPYTLRIPVAYDRSKRPSIKPFELKQSAGEQFSVDLSPHLQDPAQDPSLAVTIDHIEPKLEQIDEIKALNLQISPHNPKILEGYIPESAVGRTYYITLHANTHTGGDSEKIRVPLQVRIDEAFTPGFREDNPKLPLVFPGQLFIHDFVASHDVWPEYEDIPYEIHFAEGYVPPPWLQLENNKLFSVANVPIATKSMEIFLVIKNIPGGVSSPIRLHLIVP